MTKQKTIRSSRKASDEDIIRLNSLGVSLQTIGLSLGVHPTTIKLRLDNLGIPPADTRRSFMEDIVLSLSGPQVQWLASQLGPAYSVKDFIKNLMLEKYINSTNEKEGLE